MIYNTNYSTTTPLARSGKVYIAIFDGDEKDGTGGTYDEQEFNEYRHVVLGQLSGNWTTETDEEGVYLVEEIEHYEETDLDKTR